MNLDFLDVLSQPTQETVGTMGTVGTDSVHASLPVPNAALAVENHENQMPRSPSGAGAGDGSQQFPSGSQTPGIETPNFCADVPEVPMVPNENEQVCAERARVQGVPLDGCSLCAGAARMGSREIPLPRLRGLVPTAREPPLPAGIIR